MLWGRGRYTVLFDLSRLSIMSYNSSKSMFNVELDMEVGVPYIFYVRHISVFVIQLASFKNCSGSTRSIRISLVDLTWPILSPTILFHLMICPDAALELSRIPLSSITSPGFVSKSL